LATSPSMVLGIAVIALCYLLICNVFYRFFIFLQNRFYRAYYNITARSRQNVMYSLLDAFPSMG